jgi:hypothetical protein
MKFKNNTKYTINIKLTDWLTIEPNMVVDIPEHIAIKNGLEKVEEKKTIKKDLKENIIEFSFKIEKLSEKELKKLTKDELNDYAVKIGLDDINCYMLKKDMINKIIKFNGKNE